MKIKCPHCGCEYEPSFFDDASHCPMCGQGGIKIITTTTTTNNI